MNYLRSKKGFTLVEIIVVLVIIAILVATSLPALTGYIEDANNKTALSDGRTYLVAAQAIASEQFGLGKSDTEIEAYLTSADAGKGIAHVNKLTGATFPAVPSSITVDALTGKITNFVVQSISGKYNVTYNGTGMTAAAYTP